MSPEKERSPIPTAWNQVIKYNEAMRASGKTHRMTEKDIVDISPRAKTDKLRGQLTFEIDVERSYKPSPNIGEWLKLGGS